MKKLSVSVFVFCFALTCGAQSKKNFKLGIALWTFHTVSFPEALELVKATGLQYIEPNTFHSAGKAYNDSSVGQVSPAALGQLRKMIDDKQLTASSVYVDGGRAIDSWKRQFQTAKQLGARFVTAEPPVDMWDSIDSLAGIYNLQVAIHDHWKGTSAYWHPDSVLAAIKGHKNFGACADIGHWPKSGIDPVTAIRKLKGHIIGVHLKDIAAFNDPSLKDARLGTGVIDIPAVLNELEKQKFKGHIYIERDAEEQPDNLDSVLESIRYYNKLVK